MYMPWRLTKTLLLITELVTQTFLAFFIWETDQSLQLILLYYGAYFLTLPLSGLFSAILSDKIQPKTAILLGIWTKIIQLFLVIYMSNSLNIPTLLLLGAIGGMARGFIDTSSNIIDHFKQKYYDRSQFFAREAIIYEFFHLIIPLSAAYFVSNTGNYFLLFRSTIFILILAAVSSLFVQNQSPQSKSDFKLLFTFPGTNKDKSTLIKGIFIDGLSEGISIAVFPIIVLYFVGDILNWGFLNTAFVLAAIIISYLLKLFINDNISKGFYAIGAFIFASASIFFIVKYNFFLIIIFLLAKMFMDTIKETTYNSSIEQIIQEDQQSDRLYSEYQFLIQLFSGLGKALPVIVLIILNLNLQNEFLLRSAFLFVGILPLVVLSVLGKSAIFEAGGYYGV